MRRKHIAVLVLITAIAAAAYLLWPRASSNVAVPERAAPSISLTEQRDAIFSTSRCTRLKRFPAC